MIGDGAVLGYTSLVGFGTASGFAVLGKGSRSSQRPPFFILHVLLHQFLRSLYFSAFSDDVAVVLCLHDCVSAAVSSLLSAAAALDDFCGASSIPACGSPAHCNVVHL